MKKKEKIENNIHTNKTCFFFMFKLYQLLKFKKKIGVDIENSYAIVSKSSQLWVG